MHGHEWTAHKNTHASFAPKILALEFTRLCLLYKVLIKLVDNLVWNKFALATIRQVCLDVILLCFKPKAILILIF